MRTLPGSIGSKSSSVPPSVFRKRSVIGGPPGRCAVARDRPAATLRAIEVAARGVDRDCFGRGADDARDGVSHGVEARRTEARAGATDQEIHGRRLPARLPQVADDDGQELPRVHAARGRVCGREAAPEVATAGRREQRVRDGVERGVPVGVAVQGWRLRDADAAESEPVTRSEGVAVVALADARRPETARQQARRHVRGPLAW